MPKYAVKIGEMQLHADQPITSEQMREALQWINAETLTGIITLKDGTQLEHRLRLTIDRH